VYFQADHAVAAAQEINRLLSDEKLWSDLIENGHRRLQDFPTPREKYKQYISLMDNLLQSQPV
jgi:glycosyltransferase involved in cell wall biosynthesis